MEKIKAYGIALYLIQHKTIKILLCKSVKSNEKWGFLKGCQLDNETKEETAIREFEEESHILVDKKYLETFLIQENEEKDIGVFLVNGKNISNLDKFFYKDILHTAYLSWENSKVKFFDIKNLPPIKKKQNQLILKVVEILTKNLL